MDTFYYPDSMSSDKALRVARLRDFLFVLGAVVCVCVHSHVLSCPWPNHRAAAVYLIHGGEIC